MSPWSSKPVLFLSVNWEDFIAFCHIQLQVIWNSLESLIFCETKKLISLLRKDIFTTAKTWPACGGDVGWAKPLGQVLICFILDSVQPILIFLQLFAFASSFHYSVCFETGKRGGTEKKRHAFILKALYFLSINSLSVAGIQMYFNMFFGRVFGDWWASDADSSSCVFCILQLTSLNSASMSIS